MSTAHHNQHIMTVKLLFDNFINLPVLHKLSSPPPSPKPQAPTYETSTLSVSPSCFVNYKYYYNTNMLLECRKRLAKWQGNWMVNIGKK
jgi:hypothetical protein